MSGDSGDHARSEQRGWDAGRVRTFLFDGLASVDAFGDGAGLSRGAVFAYLKQGLPSIMDGKCRYIVLDEARTWLLASRPHKATGR